MKTFEDKRFKGDTFGEQFPSLKGQGLYPIDTNCLEGKDNVFIRGSIMANCLDKAKVRETIKLLSVEIELCEVVSTERLLKELGL